MKPHVGSCVRAWELCTAGVRGGGCSRIEEESFKTCSN